jgi:hypothetical protein
LADDWDVVIDSLGNMCLAYLGPADVDRVRIWSQPTEGSAHIEITLRKDSWENRSAAVDAMVGIRELFLDDLSFDYRFVDGDEDAQDLSAPADRLSQFAVR